MENLTIAELKKLIEDTKDIVESEIASKTGRMNEFTKSGNYGAVKRTAEKLAQILEGYMNTLVMAEEELEKKEREARTEERQAQGGFALVEEFVEVLFEQDMKWYDELMEDYREKGYSEYINKLRRQEITKSTLMFAQNGRTWAMETFKRDAEIRKARLKAQIEKKVGNVLELNLRRNENFSLDGYVVGDKATATIDTVMAGGYNIQRLHYRTLIKIKK